MIKENVCQTGILYKFLREISGKKCNIDLQKQGRYNKNIRPIKRKSHQMNFGETDEIGESDMELKKSGNEKTCAGTGPLRIGTG